MNRIFSEIASSIAHQSGRPITFLLAALIIVCWALTGPATHHQYRHHHRNFSNGLYYSEHSEQRWSCVAGQVGRTDPQLART